MKSILKSSLLLALLVLAASTNSDAYCAIQGEVRYTTARVILRAEPSTEAEPLLVITRNQALEVSCQGSWCGTQFGGSSGYVSARLLRAQRAAVDPARYRQPQRLCCKICSRGKACGNSCISRSYTCHQPPGCACNG